MHLNTVQDKGPSEKYHLSKDKATPYACKWNKRVCVYIADEGFLLWWLYGPRCMQKQYNKNVTDVEH